MTCAPWVSRRNLAHKIDRILWAEGRSERMPLRYRLHCSDGTYVVRTGQIGLAAEIKENKPFRIERLPQTGDELPFASLPEHVRVCGVKVLEVCDD